MVLTYNTVDKIDIQVAAGLTIGYFGQDDDLDKYPKQIGDWLIKTVWDGYTPNTGSIVAVPTNGRTRLIYRTGRLMWLSALGFNDHQAYQYMKASDRCSKRWDHRVARFVLENITVDAFIIDRILTSALPRRMCLEQGIYTTLDHGRVLAGCGIIKRLQAL
jgi:hypothetical protein